MPGIEFEPIGDRIIVAAWEEEDIQTKSGLIIQVRDEVNKELPQCGEVVALGRGGTFPDCPDPTNVFKVGDFVYFNRYAGEDVVIGLTNNRKEDKKYTVLRLDAIFGRLSDETAKKMQEKKEEMIKLKEKLDAAPVEVEMPTKFDKEQYKNDIASAIITQR